MLSLFTKNAGAPKLLRFGTPTFIVEPFYMVKLYVYQKIRMLFLKQHPDFSRSLLT